LVEEIWLHKIAGHLEFKIVFENMIFNAYQMIKSTLFKQTSQKNKSLNRFLMV